MSRVHHALFGDSGGRHVLLIASVERDATVEAIRVRSDLAPDRPAYVEWEPYLTGLRVQDVYVVMRTVPDRGASRAGMVLTHVAFAPLTEVVELEDIGRLVAALPQMPVRRPALPPSSLPEAPPGKPLPPSVHADLIGAVMAAAPTGRVGWLGDGGFDEAVREVWTIMTANERADFSFGFAFNPRSTPIDSPRGVSLIRTPRRLRDRWSGESIVDPENPSGTTPSPVVAARLGHSGGEEVSALLDALGQPTLSLGQFKDLGVAAGYYAMIRRDKVAPLLAVRTFAHFVGRLAPEPAKGSELKACLTNRLGSQTRTGEDLLGLRNFDPAPYADGPELFSVAARSWAHTALTIHGGRKADAAVVSAAVSAEKQAAWGKAVVKALRVELGSWRQEYADALWAWWRESEATIRPTLRWVRPLNQAERDLVARAPKRTPSPVAVEHQAAERGLLVLFAHVVAARDSDRAFPALAQLDPAGECVEAWEHVALLIGPRKAVGAAAEADSAPDVLLRVAGRVAAEYPQVFHDLNASHPGWRQVWASAVENDMGVFDGIESPVRQRNALLDAKVVDEATHALLLAIADTEAADLLDHPNRSQVWERVPAEVREAYLGATAASWTERLRSGENVDWSLEPPLARIVFDPRSNAALFDPLQPGSIALAVEAFGRTRLLDERSFIRWIEDLARGPRLSRPDAVLVGSLVDRQTWKDAAQTIFLKAKRNRSDFWDAVGHFVHLLGLFDRALFKLKSGSHPVCENEWWDMLEDAAVDLLSTASGLEHVWESAGGKVGDLRSIGTNKERVHHALRLVRDGNRVTSSCLVEALRREFETNNKLDLISQVGRRIDILPRAR